VLKGWGGDPDHPEVRRLVLFVLLLSLGAAPAARAGEIVVLEPGADASVATETAEREADLGFDADRRFSRALRGFAADLTPAQAAELRDDPEVAMVVADRRVEALAAVPAVTGERVPAGVRRAIAAPTRTVREAADGAVAVLDSGVDLEHPDLDVVAGANCMTPGAPPDDVHGHGTHVAGTIGARNTGAGVTGVAPGTRIVAVKVLGDDGSGTTSSVLCGIDYVLANASRLGIEVANFSLGGAGDPSTCASDAGHAAFCSLVAAGITPVVAAGNAGWDFGTDQPDVPAAYPEVLTVAAMVDTDGVAGGLGTSCGNPDDAHASFSNFATDAADRAHLVAAPGACVLSTAPGGGLASMSGTSMAAPHVAALVALCRAEAGTPGPCASLRPDQIITHMRATALTDAFTGTAGRDYGPLAQLSGQAPATDVTSQPPPVLTAPGDTAPEPVAGEPTAPAPAPAPAPIAPPAPVATPPAGSAPSPVRTSPRRPTLSIGRTTLRGLSRSGVLVRVRCADPRKRCSATVRLRAGGRTLATKRGTTVRLKARRLPLTAGTVTVVADVRQGTRTVRVTKPLVAPRR